MTPLCSAHLDAEPLRIRRQRLPSFSTRLWKSPNSRTSTDSSPSQSSTTTIPITGTFGPLRNSLGLLPSRPNSPHRTTLQASCPIRYLCLEAISRGLTSVVRHMPLTNILVPFGARVLAFRGSLMPFPLCKGRCLPSSPMWMSLSTLPGNT